MRYALFLQLAFVAADCAAQSSISGTHRSSPPPTSKVLPGSQIPPATEVLRSPSQQRALTVQDEYRVGKVGVSCVLPGGQSVRVTLTDDADSFLFVAVRGAYGPTILANEWRVKDARTDYAVFAFYRECAVHVMTDVKAARPLDAVYSRETIGASECLAFLQAAQTLELHGRDTRELEEKVKSGLQREYGSSYPASKSGFSRCRDRKYVAAMVEKVRAR